MMTEKKNAGVHNHSVKDESKSLKFKAMEHESNLTLISTSVAIISFFVMLYVNNAMKVNYTSAHGMLHFALFAFIGIAVICGVCAVILKKSYLWEYSIFSLVLAIGYYLLLNPGVTAFPFLYEETATTYSITPLGETMGKIFTTSHVTYGLWTVNLLYFIFAIAFHSVKYNNIKKGGKKKK